MRVHRRTTSGSTCRIQATVRQVRWPARVCEMRPAMCVGLTAGRESDAAMSPERRDVQDMYGHTVVSYIVQLQQEYR